MISSLTIRELDLSTRYSRYGISRRTREGKKRARRRSRSHVAMRVFAGEFRTIRHVRRECERSEEAVVVRLRGHTWGPASEEGKVGEESGEDLAREERTALDEITGGHVWDEEKRNMRRGGGGGGGEDDCW